MNTKHLYHLTHWESNGKYHVNDVTNLAAPSAKWYAPMRVLGLQVNEYIQLLLAYNATSLKYFEKTDYLAFYFTKESDARCFCNYINKIAKNNQFYCY